jgi:hypothetical protein
MEKIRCFLPKYFFQIVQRKLHLNKMGTRAIGFQSKIEDGLIIPAITIQEHITNLFREPTRIIFHQPRIIEKFVINETMMDDAIKKLSRDKAVGLDLLPDYFLKSRRVYQTIKKKLIGIFSEWANLGGIPDTILTGRIFALSKINNCQNPTFPKVRLLNITASTLKLHE